MIYYLIGVFLYYSFFKSFIEPLFSSHSKYAFRLKAVNEVLFHRTKTNGVHN